MSDDRPYDACEKRRYRSPEAARRANAYNPHTLRVYLCPACHAYHATKREQVR